MASQYPPASPTPSSDDFEEDGLLEKQPTDHTKRRDRRCGIPSAAWWLSNLAMGGALIYLLLSQRFRQYKVEIAGDVNRIWPSRKDKPSLPPEQIC